MKPAPGEVIEPILDPEQLREEADRLAGSLKLFIPAAWKLIEPSTFIPNWHIDGIAEHLEAVTKGDILDLLVTMPPRHSKSLIITVLWPVWEWITLPSYRWVFASYAHSLSVRDSIKRRKIIRSRWFKERWGDNFSLIPEQDTKIRYENDKHGFMLATSVEGSNTGEGGERIIADDPHNVKDSESETVRQETVDWWNIVMSTRRNDERKSARVVVQQRTHEGDVAGDIISKGGYVHLNLPTEFRFAGAPRCRTEWIEHTTNTPRHWEDPRTEPGELLNPKRFSAEANAKAKIELGDYQYACTPAGSPVLMADWTSKPIEQVVPGDEVVGFESKGGAAGYGEAQRQRLFKSKVLRTFTYRAPVYDLVMSSGRKVRCTIDHKWWTRRHPTREEPSRKSYMPAAVGRPLWFVCPPEDECTPRQRDLWQYLAGIVDGEGSVKPNILEISQSPTSNAPTFIKILAVLSELGLEFDVHTYPPAKPGHGERGQIQVANCREVYRKLLRFADPGKRDEMLDCIYGRKERLASDRDVVLGFSDPITETVYALETETGNYIVWGYASSNSQHGQNPTPPEGQIIQSAWLKYYGGPNQRPTPDWTRATHPMTPLLSADCTFKEHKDTDFVAMLGWAMFGADIYLMPFCIHKRLSFPQTIDAMAEMVGGESLDGNTKWPGVYPFMKLKVIEDKANGPAIIATLQHKIPGMFAYNPGGASKESRLQAISWRFRAGNVYLPHESIAPWVVDYRYELCAFPRAVKDDYVDATSQALLTIGGDAVQGQEPIMGDQESLWFGLGKSDFGVGGDSYGYGPGAGFGKPGAGIGSTGGGSIWGNLSGSKWRL